MLYKGVSDYVNAGTAAGGAMSGFNPSLLSDFARYYGFHYDECPAEALVKDFRLDMERGLCGKPSWMPMIPAFLSAGGARPSGKKVLALDAGGTNLRAALVSFDNEGRVTSGEARKVPMPGTQGHVSKELFFDRIAETAAPILDECRDIAGIGFCFSYPTEMTEDGDGILMAFSKEVDAPEVIGSRVGAGLRDALARRGIRYDGKIVLLNDTASTLFCGLASIPAAGIEGDDRWNVQGGPVIGFILGTGTNIAYPESTIPKTGFNNPARPQIVVMESGTFDFRYRGRLDIEYDKTTKNPNCYTTEKAVAGAYLGPLSFHILKQAVRDGVLRFKKKDVFLSWTTLETKDLNQLMRFPLAKEGLVAALFTDDEQEALASFVYLVSIITRRAGLVAAAQLAGAAEHIAGQGTIYPFAPLRIAVEGTTYVLYKGLREALESSLFQLLGKDKPIPYYIAPVESASLFGAAVAAAGTS
jgi:hexokinase